MSTQSNSSPSILGRRSYFWFIAVLAIGFIGAILTGFLLAGGPSANQPPVHQLLGMVLAGVMLMHLALHRTWIFRILRPQSKLLPRRTRINRGLGIALTVLVIVLIVSGMGLGGLFDDDIARGTVWQNLHHLAGKLMALLGTWHIVRHRNWIFRKIKKHSTDKKHCL